MNTRPQKGESQWNKLQVSHRAFEVLDVVRVRVVPSVESGLRTAGETKSERTAVEHCEKVQTRTSEIG
jgi:hypothetical protein